MCLECFTKISNCDRAMISVFFNNDDGSRDVAYWFPFSCCDVPKLNNKFYNLALLVAPSRTIALCVFLIFIIGEQYAVPTCFN